MQAYHPPTNFARASILFCTMESDGSATDLHSISSVVFNRLKNRSLRSDSFNLPAAQSPTLLSNNFGDAVKIGCAYVSFVFAK